MKVLISAYACAPEEGSEPEAGLRTVLAAARRHQVWVLTRSDNLSRLAPFMARHPLGDRVRVVGIDIGRNELASQHTLGKPGAYWHYERWQGAAGRRAIALDRDLGFDLVHHATYANYWTTVGVAAVHKPLVWGPVGGGTRVPLRLMTQLGPSNVLGEIARAAAQRVWPMLSRPLLKRRPDAVVMVQNRATAARLGLSHARIVPNATSIDLQLPEGAGQRTSEMAVVGRLIGRKGGVLAVRMLHYLNHPTARLVFVGEGPEYWRIRRTAARWGFSDRVELRGRIGRSDLITMLHRVCLLLHPALRDEAPLAVAEALTLGTPVVCLDGGGPSELARCWPEAPIELVSPGGADETALGLAAAVGRTLAAAHPVSRVLRPPATSFASEVLAAYSQAVPA